MNDFLKILKDHVVTVIFRMRGGSQVFAAVRKHQCVGIEIVEDLHAFCCLIDMHLRHCIQGIKDIGLCIEDASESLGVVFTTLLGVRNQVSVSMSALFVSY